MHTTIQSKLHGGLLLVMTIAAILGASGASACDPAAMQQANHAAQVAYDFYKAKNWDQAIPSLESALSICPDHPQSLKLLGRAYMEVQRYEDSRDIFERLVAAKGEMTDASDHMDLGRVYAQLKDYRKARQEYATAQRLDPENCNILFNLATMHFAVRDYIRSVDAYEATLSSCPDLRERVLAQLAKACKQAEDQARKIGNVAQAGEYAAKYQEYAGSSGGTTGFQLITEKMRAQDWTGAVEVAEAYLEKNPSSKSAWKNLARSARAANMQDKAITAFQRYLELDPDDHKITGTLIELYADAGRCDEGLALARAASARFAPQGKLYTASVYYGWGRALECSGEFAAAKEKFEYVTTCGDRELSNYARQQIERQDQLEARRRIQRQNAGG